MSVFQAIVLGVIQGLSEFLPISSSAHLTLAPWLLGWQDPGLAVDVALHFGTLIALVWYFRKEWMSLLAALVAIVKKGRIETESERRLVWLVVATIPGGIAGLTLQKYAESAFRSPTLIAMTLIIMGAVLWMADRVARQERGLATMRWTDAVAIGLAQMLAIVPGVSRSGSTITAGRALGFSRESAAVFSFLLSLPIITAAVAFEGRHAIREGISAPLVAGVLAAAVSGWLAISVLLKYVARHSYGLFALYRFVIGGVVLAVAAHRG